MIALGFEVYGAVCLFSLIAFLVLGAVAKLRPDLDEEGFEIGELANPEQFVNSLSVEDPAPKVLSRSAPPRPVKQSKRPVRVRPHLLHGRKPRTT
jgi:hypothetical protein